MVPNVTFPTSVNPDNRLGPLGFFTLEDAEEAPGNSGFRDQIAALEWTRKNAAAFGGNPKDVTIMGQSAGGMSVLYHMLSPKSKVFE
jgi:carboxylesterase type B